MTTTRIELPYDALVRRVDPHFRQHARRELEYEFSNGRKFYRDPTEFGPYTSAHYDFDEGFDDGFPSPPGDTVVTPPVLAPGLDFAQAQNSQYIAVILAGF